MTGLELLKAPETTASEIADSISAPCPPTIPAHCDGVSCRECWLTWLTGEPIKEKEPPDKRTAPDEEGLHPTLSRFSDSASTYSECLKMSKTMLLLALSIILLNSKSGNHRHHSCEVFREYRVLTTIETFGIASDKCLGHFARKLTHINHDTHLLSWQRPRLNYSLPGG